MGQEKEKMNAVNRDNECSE